MSRLILLDSGPLGMAANPKAKEAPLRCQLWLKALLKKGARVGVPEIADYEVRRELIRAGLTKSVSRLDSLKQSLEYIPIQTDAVLLAANLWATARQAGQPTADPKALDGDVILCAQALLLCNESTEVIIATTNVAHLSRFTAASYWQSIK